METCFVLLATMLGLATSYNVEINKVGVARGLAGSEYGFAVALAKGPGWDRVSKPNFVLLVGSPNRTVNSIDGHGMLVRCDSPEEEVVTCTDMTEVKDVKDICSGVTSGEQTHCEKQMRLGSTIAVNKNFVSGDAKMPMVTVCAPGWKNVLQEHKSPWYQTYPIGMCLKLGKDLDTLPCTRPRERDFHYCWPFWPIQNTQTYRKGRPYYTYAQAGMSAAFTKDGLSEVVGAPGVNDWRGSYRAYQKGWTLDESADIQDDQDSKYFGYAIAAGDLKLYDAEIAAGIPNFYSGPYGHIGMVELLKGKDTRGQILFGAQRTSCGNMDFANINTIDKSQMGTKFGAAVAAIDVTGDNKEELFVGAPLYSGKHPDEGRVFVYISTARELCGPVAILTGAAGVGGLEDMARFARFGSSVAAAGDLNSDGFGDVAVGAPYEDNGRGAVYIYHGKQGGVHPTFTQRIAGRDVHSDLRSFGWSIAGDADIDKNGYPDLAVGAYSSNMAAVFRSRPIVSISASMVIHPKPIPVNASKAECSLDGRLCFNVTVKFYMKGKGISDTLRIEWVMKADTLLKKKVGASRVEFRGRGTDTINETVSLRLNELSEHSYTLDVKKYKNSVIPNEIWTALVMEGDFRLLEVSSQFQRLDPILDATLPSHITEQGYFDKKCKVQEECTSDLSVAVSLFLLDKNEGKSPEQDVIYVDGTTELRMLATVTNLNDTSYQANVTAEADVFMKEINAKGGDVEANCKSRDILSRSTEFNCTAYTKLDQSESFQVIAYFDTSRGRLMPNDDIEGLQETVNVMVAASQVNEDTNKKNNKFTKTLDVKLKYNIEIREWKAISEQVRYRADPSSSRELQIFHMYTIINNGPSPLPKTFVNITVPLRKGDKEIAWVEAWSSMCTPVDHQGQLTTTPLPTTVTTTRRSTIGTPPPQRRRRDTDPVVAASSTDSASRNNTISCDEYECVTLVCLCTDLNKWANETFNITIRVIEKNLATETDLREIRYGTTATATDPSIWYGGKVVPFEKTPYAEKWTTFVKEGAPSEVNIWIIIGSVLGAVALLIIVVLVLWKLGFFTRKKHADVQKWKQESLYKRRSQAVGTSGTGSTQPYTQVDKPSE